MRYDPICRDFTFPFQDSFKPKTLKGFVEVATNKMQGLF